MALVAPVVRVARRGMDMIEVDPRTRSAIWGIVGVILAAGWVAYGLLGDENSVFLAIMVILTIILGGLATFVFRARTSS